MELAVDPRNIGSIIRLLYFYKINAVVSFKIDGLK